MIEIQPIVSEKNKFEKRRKCKVIEFQKTQNISCVKYKKYEAGYAYFSADSPHCSSGLSKEGHKPTSRLRKKTNVTYKV